MPRLGRSDLDVFPLCLGTNVFGWTVDEAGAFAVLDAYAEAGGNFLDTADMYAAWANGGRGGQSETIIGRWMAARGNRDRMVIATKVAKLDGLRGLAPATIARAAEGSLRRLRTDRIDLYYAHEDDPATPIAETLGAFAELVAAGKVRHVGASNFTAGRLRESLDVAAREGLPAYVALQPHLSLVERDEYPPELADACVSAGLGVAPYAALAGGFLTGKYRPGGPPVASERASGASAYLRRGGEAVLRALDEVAAAHATTVAAAALAWLRAQPAVVAPIASARTPAQLADLLPMATLELTPADLALLDSSA